MRFLLIDTPARRVTARLLRTLLPALTALLAFGAAPAFGAYAPIDQPGPPLDVPAAQLAAALICTPGVAHATRAPVLLVPGSGSTPAAEFSWNYEPALTKAGIPWCAVTLPISANGDIQTAGEYLVSAIRTMYAQAGRRISIIGHRRAEWSGAGRCAGGPIPDRWWMT